MPLEVLFAIFAFLGRYSLIFSDLKKNSYPGLQGIIDFGIIKSLIMKILYFPNISHEHLQLFI